jgi:hypothetical protein
MAQSTDHRRPTPVTSGELTDAQCAGTACVWCGEALGPLSRRPVGTLGRSRLFGCPTCAATKRLPVWPEFGSA